MADLITLTGIVGASAVTLNGVEALVDTIVLNGVTNSASTIINAQGSVAQVLLTGSISVTGPQGATGATGATGPQGAPGSGIVPPDTVYLAVAQTLTNKDVKSATNTFANVITEASSATPTPTGEFRQNELYETALATNITIAAPTGTPVNGNKIIFRFKDNGSARSIAYNAIYRAVGPALPLTTLPNKTLYIGACYDSISNKWDIIAVGQEA